MSLLGIGFWIIAGAVAASYLVKFWDSVQQWLNNVAADLVERLFGYDARDRMHKAVTRVDRFMDKIKNKATIYTKKNDYDNTYYKTDILAESSVYEIDSEVLEEIRKKGEIVQEFEYRK